MLLLQRIQLLAGFVSLALIGCAMADVPDAKSTEPAKTQAASQAAEPVSVAPFDGKLTPDSPADHILDALDARGRDLTDFTADVTLETIDPVALSSDKRSGKVWYHKQAPGDERIRVTFTKRQKNEGRTIKQKIDYLLDDGWLTERDYESSKQMRRQVLKPGEKINLLKLGEGPFPLPLGQKKEDVHQMFDVKKLDPSHDLDESVKPPADTVRVQLTPKPDGQFSDDFKTINVWVDLASGMPRRIETLDVHAATIRTTDLENVKINTSTNDDAFKLEKLDLDKWEDRSESFGQ